MLDLGFVSAILSQNNLEEVIDFAAAENFKCVEIMCWPQGEADRKYAGVTHINVEQLSDETVAAIKDLLQNKGVYISALGYYPNPLDPDILNAEAAISHIKKVITAAAKLGLNKVNTFIGRDPHKSLQQNFELFEKVWPPIIQLAEDSGIRVGIENCPMFFTMNEWPGGKNLAISPAIWERMFNIIPSTSFGLNYDPSHLIWQQMNCIQPLYDFKDRLIQIHIKDAKIHKAKLDKVGILSTPLEYHDPTLPGRGDVPWPQFFKALNEIEYSGPVCIEVEDKTFENSEEDKKNALRLSRDYVAPYIV